MRKLVKLYEVPRNSKIDIEHLGWGLSGSDEIIKEIDFHYIDGAFSYCEYNGKPIHLSASTEVYIVD